jgi:predicted secreted protein
MIRRRYLTVAVLAAVCVLAALFAAVPTWSSPGVPEYDLWCDVNNDGKINIKDILMVCKLFGATGQNLTEASIQYDSGWLNITDKCGQNITITHNLNTADIMVDVQGKTAADGGPHQRYYGLTQYMPGWSKTYGGTNAELAQALVRTSDGGYALAGYTNSSGAGSYDAWLVKTDSAGDTQWNKTYGGTKDDFGLALVQTSDGGYALAGCTNSFGVGGYDFWLVKTDSNGNMQWNKTYGGSGDDYAGGLVQTSDGGYALAGYNFTFGVGSWNVGWLVKTNSTGDMQWNKTYGGGGIFGGTTNELVQTSDGGYALGGWTASYSVGGWNDPWLVKTNSAGDMQWNKTYASPGGGQAYALVQTSDGGYALTGFIISSGAIGFDAWLVKTDSNGNALWSKTYGGAGKDVAYAFVQTSDGGYALAGSTNSLGAGSYDLWLVKTDSSGNMQWNKTYGGTSDDQAYALGQTSDGGYALAGSTNSFGAGNADAWLVKTDVESGLAWTDSSANSITLYRGATDLWWNFVRVRIWQVRNP